MDSPAANAAFAKQIGVTFPLLSDPKGKVLEQYGVLMRGKQVADYNYEWAQRTTFVVDKNGVIQHVELGDSAVDPNNAVAVCTGLHKKQAGL